MPDRESFDLDAVKARQAAARAEAAATSDRNDTWHLAADAINACTICDDDGYRGNRICDHTDHAQAAARGIARCRDALAYKQLTIDDGADQR